MSDRPYKAFERQCSRLINGARFPANSGGLVDVESATEVGQCKLLAINTHVTLTQLAVIVARLDTLARERGKRGLVFLKLKAGSGIPSPTLVIQTAEAWKEGERHDVHAD